MYELEHHDWQLSIARDYGPRVVSFSLKDGRNVFGEAKDVTEQTEWGPWQAYAGHRFWVAPEHKPFTYDPDNDPVEIKDLENKETGCLVQGPISPHTGLQKSLRVSVQKARIRIDHILLNHSQKSYQCAPWPVSIMAPGSEIWIPQEPYRSHQESVLPSRPVAWWPYSDPTDQRLMTDRQLLGVQNNPDQKDPFKIGVGNFQGWAAVRHDDLLFMKTFPKGGGAGWPDHGVNCEIYTEGAFIEIESLGYLRTLAPGGQLNYREHWALKRLDQWPDDSEGRCQLMSVFREEMKASN